MGYQPRHAAPPERRLARGLALTAAAASAAAGIGLAAADPPPAQAATRVSAYYLDRDTSSYVKSLIGRPYSWGGTGPWSFDCSGLTQYVYGHFGYAIPRTADEQFHYFRQIPKSRAWGGDLVFFHTPSGYTYHVGIWEGGYNMVSAVNYAYGVRWTPLSWGGYYVTYGTISH